MIRIRKTGRVTAVVLAAGAVTALAGAPAQAATTGSAGWTADLSTVDTDDVNVAAAGGTLTLADAAWHRTARVFAGSEGSLITAEHTLGAPANRVSAELSADTPEGTSI